MDAILNPRFAGSELDKQEVSEAAVARILASKLILPWEVYGGFTETGDLAFKEPGDQLFLKKITKFLYNESLPSRFKCNPPLLSPLWVILA